MESKTQTRSVSGTEHSWCKAVPGGTGTTVVALHFSRSISLSSLHSSLLSLLTHHPILTSLLSFTSKSSPPFFSIPASPNVSIDTKPLSCSFDEVVQLEMNENPWLESNVNDPKPVFFCTLYEAEKSSVLALRLHTAACDRVSAASLLKELVHLMLDKSGETKDPNLVDDVAVKSGIEDLIPKRDSHKPFWARGKDMIGYSLNSLRASTLGFEDTESARRGEMIRIIFTKEETQNLLNECKERGVKLCGAISAAGLIAARISKQLELSKSDTYAIVTLVDCRKFLEPPLEKNNIGFYHSAITNTFSLTGSESFWDVAKKYHNSYTNSISNKKHLTDISDLNFLMCKAIQNPSLTASSSLRSSLLSVFDEPVVYENHDDMKKLGLVDYVGCASAHGIGPSLGVFDSVRNGELELCCVYPIPLHSRRQMEGICESMKSLLVRGSMSVDLD